MTSIWILRIEHKYGQTIYVCSSEAIAEAWLLHHVRENWREAFLGDFNSVSGEEAIRRYWEYFSEAAGEEFYELFEEPLLSVAPKYSSNDLSKE